MSSRPLQALLFLLGIVLFAVWMRAHHVRKNAMVAAWAAQNDYQILQAKTSWFPPLGLAWSTSKYQEKVRMRVFDRTAHRIRDGWLILGSYWFGLLDAQAIEVRWDDPS